MNGAKVFTRGDALMHPVNCRAAIVDGKPTPESLLLDIKDSAQFKSFVKRGNILEEMPRERAKCKCRARFSTIRGRHSRDVAGIITTPLMAVSMGVDPPEARHGTDGLRRARLASSVRPHGVPVPGGPAGFQDVRAFGRPPPLVSPRNPERTVRSPWRNPRRCRSP